MAKICLTILGSSAGMPQADRVNAGLVLSVGQRSILLDCGGGVSAAFRRYWFDPLKVERVIITHTHPDHISDLPLFVQMLYLAERREPFVIHLPSEALSYIQDYFQALYLLREKLPFEIEFLPIPKETDIHTEGVDIHPICNTHLHGYQPLIEEYHLCNKMQCYSLYITAGNKTILYSSDLGSEKDVIPHLRNLDLLVIESTHIDVGRLYQAVIENRVQRVVLTHLTETYDGRAALAAARKAGLDNVTIAADGMKFDL